MKIKNSQMDWYDQMNIKSIEKDLILTTGEKGMGTPEWGLKLQQSIENMFWNVFQ